jgi:hypothetical protein
MHHRVARLCFLACASLLTTTTVAHADDETADAAYKRGAAALRAGRIHEACQAFEASDKIDAKLETEAKLAECYEQDAKPMAASRLYAKLAEKDTSADRSKKYSQKAAALEAKAPRLRILINPRPSNLVVKVDGAEVSGTDVRVDVGPHEVIATAPGYEGHASPAVDRDRAIVDVIVRMDQVAEPEKPVEKPTPKATTTTKPTEETPAEKTAPMAKDEPADKPMPAMMKQDTVSSGGHRKRNGVIAGVVGLGMLTGAIISFEIGQTKFDHARDLCPGGICTADIDFTNAKDLNSQGRVRRGLAYGLGAGGAVLLGVGAYLLLTPHKESSAVAFDVGNGGASVSYSASF